MWLTFTAAMLAWAATPNARRHAMARLQPHVRAPMSVPPVSSPGGAALVVGFLAFGITGGLAWAIAAAVGVFVLAMLLLRQRRRKTARRLEAEGPISEVALHVDAFRPDSCPRFARSGN